VYEALAAEHLTPEARMEIFSQRPAREWSVNSIRHAIARHEKKIGLRPAGGHPGGLGPVLKIDGFGEIRIRDTDDGKELELTTEEPVTVGRPKAASSRLVRFAISVG
jgi:hypothetical protein